MRKKFKRKNIIYVILKKGNSLFEKYIKTKRRLLFIILITLFVLFIISRYQKIFFTILLILLGILSFIHNRYFRYSHYIGFELCTMATVLTSLAYGPTIGAIAGFVSITGGFIVGGYFKHTSFVSVLTLPLIGIITPFFSELPLPYLGVLMTLFYDAIIIPLYTLMGSRITSGLTFFITHIFLNYWVFSTIAPIFLNLMT
jgi:hypothetical protein